MPPLRAAERKFQTPSSNIQRRTRAAPRSSRARARDLAQAHGVTRVNLCDQSPVVRSFTSFRMTRSGAKIDPPSPRLRRGEAIVPFILATLCLIFGSRDE